MGFEFFGIKFGGGDKPKEAGAAEAAQADAGASAAEAAEAMPEQPADTAAAEEQFFGAEAGSLDEGEQKTGTEG